MPAPRSTYRVQVRPDFDLWQTAGLAEYLAALGVSHLYSAPLLEAAPGSQHGYDVVDHGHASSQLGGEEARRALVGALHAHGLGLVIDIVPNHMGVAEAAANPWWWDVLQLGPQSAYARYFDIDWSRGRLLLPFLGDEPDELDHLRIEDGKLCYFEHRFPLAAGTDTQPTARDAHDHQHYELVSWRRGDAEVNYRRFFAVSTLAGLRVEEPEVFEATHREILRWVAEGDVDGIRVDHPDGLAEPAAYLERLAGVAPETWLVIEKILEPGEQLPPWPTNGTTGYDALAGIDRAFVDPAARDAFTALQEEIAGPTPEWAQLVHDCKLEVITSMQRAELDRLTRLAGPIEDAGAALAELLACFPVYRSFLPEVGQSHLDQAFWHARSRRPDLRAAFDALGERLYDISDELAVRFQQQSGAVMAKGVEDTAYYRFTRFVAANEVGGDPATIGGSLTDFHAEAQRRQQEHPLGMTALSTHDTKRGEDVRARLAVLSEIPDEWADAVRRWHSIAPITDGSFAHLLWQTVVGTWPIEADRLHAYLLKAAREAGASTSWNDPDEKFEAAVHAVVDRLYSDGTLHDEVEEFTARITPYGWSNSLGAKLVQLTMPGIPDVYQGTEFWENSLVDPDNRRDVDFSARAQVVQRLDTGYLPDIDATGHVKALVVSRALRLRRDRPDAFSGYTPLAAQGPAQQHALAFDRGGVITVATRLPVRLERAGGWRDSALPLPDGQWRDMLTGTTHTGNALLADILNRYPVALLARENHTIT